MPAPLYVAIPTPRRALILKPCCIGDVLMTTPLARAIKQRWPDVVLDWAVDAHSRPVLAGNPHVAELVDASHCIRGDLRWRFWLRTAIALRRRKYDVVYTPDRSPLLTALAWATGAPVRVGLASGRRGWAHTVRIPTTPYDPRHESVLYLALDGTPDGAMGATLGATVGGTADGSGDVTVERTMEGVGSMVEGVRRVSDAPTIDDGDSPDLMDLSHLRPVFHPSEADTQAARALLATLDVGGSGRPLVVIHPGGGENPGTHMPSKRWPAARFGALAARLAKGGVEEGVAGRAADSTAEGTDVVVVGGPDDRALAAEVIARATEAAHDGATGMAAGGAAAVGATDVGATAGQVVDASGRLSLGGTAALIDSAEVYVGNDSGVAHLAAAVGTPAVVLFGPTSSQRYGPVPGAGVAVVAGAVGAASVGDGPREAEANRIATIPVAGVEAAVRGALAGDVR